ncbi:hypothetical protein EYF80_020277 [Liparis tanakae]|uniref:Uncharacterized protein n=1 Tax=Liparis tanakae TaxID=230148 RepID=A0A4Z2HWS9_9TELE|nr:hypothetical protein EYF80_020277 [Liparis tanakae]
MLWYTEAHLQHGVQHVDLAGLVPGLRQSEALGGAHPVDPLHHSLQPGELHQHVLLLWTQAQRPHGVVHRLTHHLSGGGATRPSVQEQPVDSRGSRSYSARNRGSPAPCPAPPATDTSLNSSGQSLSSISSSAMPQLSPLEDRAKDAC